MRELTDVEPRPMTEVEILRFGLTEIAQLAPGSHQTDPAYGARREVKDYARRILEATAR